MFVRTSEPRRSGPAATRGGPTQVEGQHRSHSRFPGAAAQREAQRWADEHSSRGFVHQLVSSSCPVVQRWPPKGGPKANFSGSGYQITARKNTKIYMLYDKSTNVVDYIGKTIQSGDKRFQQHQKKKQLGSDTKTQTLRAGYWTRFETATHEQYCIALTKDDGKYKVDNKNKALDLDKWNWFKAPRGHPINNDQETALRDKDF